jgi:hypothetical protein
MKRYDELSPEDKARFDFYSQLDSEGGLEGMYRYNGFKNKNFKLPKKEQAVLDRLAAALREADALIVEYSTLADDVTYGDDTDDDV